MLWKIGRDSVGEVHRLATKTIFAHNDESGRESDGKEYHFSSYY